MRETYRMMRTWGVSRVTASRLAWTLGRKLKRHDPVYPVDTWGRVIVPPRAQVAEPRRCGP
jgi:hypothetical protein